MKPIDDGFLNRCNTVTEEYEKICGRWNADAQIFHIVKEVCEFSEVIRNKKQKFGAFDSDKYRQHLADEYADIHLTGFATANYFGFSNEFINNSLMTKLHIVEQRVIEESKKLGNESKKLFEKATNTSLD